jgi:hypothetical protein
VREHEADEAGQPARQRIPGVEVETVVFEHPARNVVIDQTQIVLDEREKRVGEDQARLLPKCGRVEFVERNVCEFVQEQ